MLHPLYLDHNASTCPDPAVVESMLPWLGSAHANPHSQHLAGQRASSAINSSLQSIATLIGASPQDLILTSGATESNNIAIQGILAHASKHSRLLHSTIEHKAVIEVGAHLQKLGVQVDELPVDRDGYIDLSVAARVIADSGPGLTLLSVMHANNEIGTVQPISELAALLASTNSLMHVDAAQSVGKIEVNVTDLGVDLLSISAHKLYGPAGIGALYISPKARRYLRPLFFGGGQQAGVRPGTVPVALAVGFGTACDLARRRLSTDAANSEAAAKSFCEHLLRLGVNFQCLESNRLKIPGLRSIRFIEIDGNDLVSRLAPKISISTGSACTSGEINTSHVLRAIGFNEDWAREVVRVGFGRYSTMPEAITAAEIVAAAISKLRDTTNS